jgi:hypothetical protein
MAISAIRPDIKAGPTLRIFSPSKFLASHGPVGFSSSCAFAAKVSVRANSPRRILFIRYIAFERGKDSKGWGDDIDNFSDEPLRIFRKSIAESNESDSTQLSLSCFAKLFDDLNFRK